MEGNYLQLLGGIGLHKPHTIKDCQIYSYTSQMRWVLGLFIAITLATTSRLCLLAFVVHFVAIGLLLPLRTFTLHKENMAYPFYFFNTYDIPGAAYGELITLLFF